MTTAKIKTAQQLPKHCSFILQSYMYLTRQANTWVYLGYQQTYTRGVGEGEESSRESCARPNRRCSQNKRYITNTRYILTWLSAMP